MLPPCIFCIARSSSRTSLCHLRPAPAPPPCRQLRDWLDLSLHRGLPSSLLLLSRAFTITAPVADVAAKKEVRTPRGVGRGAGAVCGGGGWQATSCGGKPGRRGSCELRLHACGRTPYMARELSLHRCCLPAFSKPALPERLPCQEMPAPPPPSLQLASAQQPAPRLWMKPCSSFPNCLALGPPSPSAHSSLTRSSRRRWAPPAFARTQPARMKNHNASTKTASVPLFMPLLQLAFSNTACPV